MGSVKVAIAIDRETPIRVDASVAKSTFPNRSRAIQAAASEELAHVVEGLDEIIGIYPHFRRLSVRT